MYIELVHVYVYFKDKNNKKQYTKYVFFFRIRCQQIPVDYVCFKMLSIPQILAKCM